MLNIIAVGKKKLVNFEYKSSKDLDQKYRVTGILGTYGGGGLKYTGDKKEVKELKEIAGVINEATRALIIEWTMYNPSEEFYAYCRIVLIQYNLSYLNLLLLVLLSLHISMSDPFELDYTKVHAIPP